MDDPGACVYVGDRLFDDVWGAHNAGLKAIHIPLSTIPAGQVGHTEGDSRRHGPLAPRDPRGRARAGLNALPCIFVRCKNLQVGSASAPTDSNA